MATTASPEESFSQVTWETALWTLIPLAINTMSQPSGRVCGFPAKYRTYLRSSPLFCLADSLSILIHLILYLTTFPFKDGIRLVIQQRFGKEGDEDADEGREEGIQAIEKLTWLRWLFFVLGTLGPGIKLMAMEGVPWAKAFGAIFLISFVMVEVLVILSWLYGEYEAVPEAHDAEAYDAEKLKKTKDKLSEIDDWLRVTARALHGVLLVWAAVDIHNGFHDHFLFPLEPFPSFLGPLFDFCCGVQFFIFELMLMFMLILLLPWLKMILSLLHHFLVYSNWESGIGAVALVCIQAWAIWILRNYGLFKKEILIDLVVDWAYLLAFGFPLLLVEILLGSTGERVPRWARSIFITLPSPEEGKKRRSGMDSNLEVTYWCFMLFFYSTVLCVVWYAHRYNPEGTVNRGWTGVFG